MQTNYLTPRSSWVTDREQIDLWRRIRRCTVVMEASRHHRRRVHWYILNAIDVVEINENAMSLCIQSDIEIASKVLWSRCASTIKLSEAILSFCCGRTSSRHTRTTQTQPTNKIQNIFFLRHSRSSTEPCWSEILLYVKRTWSDSQKTWILLATKQTAKKQAANQHANKTTRSALRCSPHRIVTSHRNFLSVRQQQDGVSREFFGTGEYKLKEVTRSETELAAAVYIALGKRTRPRGGATFETNNGRVRRDAEVIQQRNWGGTAASANTCGGKVR